MYLKYALEYIYMTMIKNVLILFLRSDFVKECRDSNKLDFTPKSNRFAFSTDRRVFPCYTKVRVCSGSNALFTALLEVSRHNLHCRLSLCLPATGVVVFLTRCYPR